jgi:hypothetical protein
MRQWEKGGSLALGVKARKGWHAMAHEAKTRPGTMQVADYLAGLAPDRRAEAERLIPIFSEVTGYPTVIWAGSMVGFGRYDYTYDSGHSGTSFATGFAARKAELSLYILPGYGDFAPILARLGKHRTGKSCLYLKRLQGVDERALRDLIRAGLDVLGRCWTVHPA